MHIDKYKQPDGWFKYEECDYEDVVSLIQIGILGFCGCGNPEGNLLHILGGLELIDEKSPDGEAFAPWFKGHQERVVAHFGNQQAADFFYYWADDMGFTEHGGSIPGWLDTAGVELMEDLRELRTAGSLSD